MKTIVTIWHSGGKGKTSTLREVANLLISINPSGVIFSNSSPIIPNGDFRLIIKINGKKIAIESKGDPNSGLKERLDEILKDYSPDIILCASRTRGKTVTHIDNFASKNGYQQIWTSTYHIDNNHDIVNKLKAKHLIELLQTLNLT